MERPHQLARVHVPRAHVAGRPSRRILLRRPAGDDEVLVDDRRRAQAVAARQALQDLRRVQIDRRPCRRTPRSASRSSRRASTAWRRSSRRRFAAASARRRASTRHRASTDCPEGSWNAHASLPVVGIERDDAVVRRREIHRAVDDERRDFTRREARTATPAAAALGGGRRRVSHGSVGAAGCRCAGTSVGGRRGRLHVIHPGHLQLVDVRRRHLRQRREAHAARIVTVGRPLLGSRRIRLQRRTAQEHQCQVRLRRRRSALLLINCTVLTRIECLRRSALATELTGVCACRAGLSGPAARRGLKPAPYI